MIHYPKVATRDCEHCKQFIYDEKTGRPYEQSGRLVERHKGCKVMCETETGCPKGTPENSKELSPKNILAYNHYRECKAIGSFPDDAIVKQNASIIRMIEDEAEETRSHRLHELIQAMIGR